MGLLAPVLFVILRLAQGFSAGGEYSGALVFLVEQAPQDRRGRMASLGAVTSGTGVLLASGAVLLLTQLTTQAQMEAWGWRVGYVFGLVLALVALALRLQMEETEAFARVRRAGLAASPMARALRESPRQILVAALLTGFAGLGYYMVLTFIPTYLESVVEVDHAEAMLVTTLVVAIWAYATPLAGMLSDRVGRKPVLLASVVTFAFASVPLFFLISTGDLAWILLAEVLLVIPLVLWFGAESVALPELFPTHTRYTGLSIGYNTGNAVLGSTAPFVGTLLVATTGVDTSPGWYLAIVAALMIPVVLAIAETARRPLKERPAPAGA